jgi:hypothetical protein
MPQIQFKVIERFRKPQYVLHSHKIYSKAASALISYNKGFPKAAGISNISQIAL